MSEKVKIKSKKVSVFYGDKKALDSINLEIPEKKVTSLIGPSGCGKSTFLRCLNRMNDTIDICRIEGEIFIDDKNIYEKSLDPVLLRARIGMVFQQFNVWPHLDVLENVIKAQVVVGKKNSEVIEESLEIILWALSESKKENIKLIYFPENKKEDIFKIINENDNVFKYHLDRFKYATRYKDSNEEFHFKNAIKFIQKLSELLVENKYFFGDSPTIADWSIWPFVRQFRIACESQKRTNYFESSIKNWLDTFEKNREFKSLMYKYELWEPNSRKNYFPSN